jgi:hypothetical protein
MEPIQPIQARVISFLFKARVILVSVTVELSSFTNPKFVWV